MADGTQIRRGVGLAAAAALSFGATVPLLKRASAGAGVFACASPSTACAGTDSASTPATAALAMKQVRNGGLSTRRAACCRR